MYNKIAVRKFLIKGSHRRCLLSKSVGEVFIRQHKIKKKEEVVSMYVTIQNRSKIRSCPEIDNLGGMNHF